MKTKKLLLVMSFLFIITGMGGCDDKSDDLVWKISPESGQTVIQNEVDGIIFKFCLLNEAGNPATVFKEGENFTFYFSVTNNRNKKLFFAPDFAYSNENGFCDVYTSDGQNIGMPYKFLQALMIGSGAYPFESGESKVFQVQWTDNRDAPWNWEKGTYESSHQAPLIKGHYYTEFKHQFWFDGTSDNSDIITDILNFKINFKIE
jgi:hypothetical protein